MPVVLRSWRQPPNRKQCDRARLWERFLPKTLARLTGGLFFNSSRGGSDGGCRYGGPAGAITAARNCSWLLTTHNGHLAGFCARMVAHQAAPSSLGELNFGLG
jgi:hypothetical protein